MNINRFTISITAGIAVVLLLIEGTGTTTVLLNTAHAQPATLGEPYFVEKGKITSQKEIGANRTQFTISV
jgi:acyl-coenzyme A thioesterase PaaI-like protein